MRTRFFFISLIALPFLLTVIFMMGDNGGSTMVKIDDMQTITAALPPIDKELPAVIKTATFALG